MNKNNYIVFDFETGSAKPDSCEVIEVCAAALDAKTLEVKDKFYSLVKPVDFNNLEQQALDINKKTVKELEVAPDRSVVWPLFCDFIKRYKISGASDWNNPIPVGHNIDSFDIPIFKRVCEAHKIKSPFHPIYTVDTIKVIFQFFENLPEPQKYNMDSLRDFFGISKVGAHEAEKDVDDSAAIFRRFMQYYRKISTVEKFKGAFANV